MKPQHLFVMIVMTIVTIISGRNRTSMIDVVKGTAIYNHKNRFIHSVWNNTVLPPEKCWKRSGNFTVTWDRFDRPTHWLLKAKSRAYCIQSPPTDDCKTAPCSVTVAATSVPTSASSMGCNVIWTIWSIISSNEPSVKTEQRGETVEYKYGTGDVTICQKYDMLRPTSDGTTVLAELPVTAWQRDSVTCWRVKHAALLTLPRGSELQSSVLIH